MSTPDRFWALVDKTEGCWLWTGPLRKGYGQFGAEGQHFHAHRWSYEQLVEPIPKGLTLDHLCRTPLCVRPDHLEPVTLAENVLRGESIPAQNARKTECKYGHSLADAYVWTSKTGHVQRHCRQCHRERARRDYHKGAA